MEFWGGLGNNRGLTALNVSGNGMVVSLEMVFYMLGSNDTLSHLVLGEYFETQWAVDADGVRHIDGYKNRKSNAVTSDEKYVSLLGQYRPGHQTGSFMAMVSNKGVRKLWLEECVERALFGLIHAVRHNTTLEFLSLRGTEDNTRTRGMIASLCRNAARNENTPLRSLDLSKCDLTPADLDFGVTELLEQKKLTHLR